MRFMKKTQLQKELKLRSPGLYLSHRVTNLENFSENEGWKEGNQVKTIPTHRRKMRGEYKKEANRKKTNEG